MTPCYVKSVCFLSDTGCVSKIMVQQIWVQHGWQKVSKEKKKYLFLKKWKFTFFCQLLIDHGTEQIRQYMANKTPGLPGLLRPPILRVLGSPWIPGTPETPNGLNFEDRGSPELQHSRDSRYPSFCGYQESRECWSPGLPLSSKLRPLGVSGVPECRSTKTMNCTIAVFGFSVPAV